MVSTDYTYPLHAKILHAGMAVFGITAFLTGEFAEYGAGTPGYLLHAGLGFSLAAFVLLRITRGFAAAGPLRFRVYLALHIGSVLLHSLSGRPIWQRMWKFRTNSPGRQEQIAATAHDDTL